MMERFEWPLGAGNIMMMTMANYYCQEAKESWMKA